MDLKNRIYPNLKGTCIRCIHKSLLPELKMLKNTKVVFFLM
jgi:hypothetical protein